MESPWEFCKDAMRIRYEDMKGVFEDILLSRGLSAHDAVLGAKIFSDNSLCGVLSHGVNRFPRVIEYIDNGGIDVKSKCEVVFTFGPFERWNCHRGFGPLNAAKAMERAIEISKKAGVGVVALGNNNHWMRGGTYAEMASSAGSIGICWSNTMPNMPSWGARNPTIGNNPLCIAVPRKSGAPFLLDMAISQYSYGKLERERLAGRTLPYPGGFDEEGNLTSDPSLIEKSRRLLPMGYWKGSGLSIALDLLVTLLSEGLSVKEIGELEAEIGLSQIMIALDPEKFGIDDLDSRVSSTLEYVKSATVAEGFKEISYPGEGLARARKENEENGIEVVDEVWDRILFFRC